MLGGNDVQTLAHLLGLTGHPMIEYGHGVSMSRVDLVYTTSSPVTVSVSPDADDLNAHRHGRLRTHGCEWVDYPRSRSLTRIRTAFLLGLLSFLVYNANLREVSSQDTIPARVLPVALVQERTVTLDMFFRDWPPGMPLPYWVQPVNGHYLSRFPLLPGLLAVPVYAVPGALLGGASR